MPSVQQPPGPVPGGRGNVTIYPPTVNRAESIGDGTRIAAFCDIGAGVVIGRDCNVQSHVTLASGTVLGDRVFVGPRVSILNDRYMDGCIEPVRVGDGARIGAGSIVLPGVRLGAGCLVAAASLVTRHVPPGAVVRGQPARVVARAAPGPAPAPHDGADAIASARTR